MIFLFKQIRGGGIAVKSDGFGIMADDMPAMIKFYRDVLGFEIKEDENASNVFLEKDGILFLLYRKTDFKKVTGRTFSYVKGINWHYEIALSVANYAQADKVFADVTKAGAEKIMEPVTMPCRQRTSYIAAPEGNLTETGSFTEK